MEQQQDTTQAERLNAPAESAMNDIMAALDEYFRGDQAQPAVMASICQIAGRYKMEAIG